MKSAKAKSFGSRYEVKKRLGKGSYGIVYLVEDHADRYGESLKALKTIRLDGLEPEEYDSAVKEAKLMQELKNPYIVKFIDSFVDKQCLCIVTEFCEGGDLSSVILENKQRDKFMPEDKAISWFIQMVLATGYLHCKHMLHRDLKSSNIYIKNDCIKIGDFGISKFLSSTCDMAHTWIGTPYYMSPEALMHKGYNNKSDIWSLGVILYEMCASKRPFLGSTITQYTKSVVDGVIPKLPEQFSDQIQYLIEKILVKKPEDRPSASEILQVPYIKLKTQELAKKMTLESMGDEKKANENVNRVNEMWKTIDKTSGKRKSLLEVSHVNHAKLNKVDEEDSVLSPRERMLMMKKIKADSRAVEIMKATEDVVKNKELARSRKEAAFSTSAVFKPQDESKMTRATSAGIMRNMNHDSDSSTDDSDEENRSARRLCTQRVASACVGQEQKNPRAEDLVAAISAIALAQTVQNSNDQHSSNARFELMDDKTIANSTQKNNNRTDFDQSSIKLNYLSSEEDVNQKTMDDKKPVDALFHAINQVTEDVDLKATASDLYGPEMRIIKINNMRKLCIETLGAEKFAEAYTYLYNKRVVEQDFNNESLLFDKLISICNSNQNIAFMLDQLIFLESTQD